MTPRGGARKKAGRKPMPQRNDVQFRMHQNMFEGLETLRLASAKVPGGKAMPRSTWYCEIVEKAIDAGADLPEAPLRNGQPRRLTKISMPGESGIELGGRLRYVDLYGRAVRRKEELQIGQLAGFVRRCLAWYAQERATADVAAGVAEAVSAT